MRLTKIEINGFKSFARKTEIEFGDGVTAIIGPNGSGKSNIADAVRWVLGEQSARVLRGAKMEDVIFSGTEQKRPQGYCEVALTFDNSDGSLKIDFSEVSIMRRVYRSGESEYFINRASCRLRDIAELFRDTGIGRDGYSIIGQGRVEEILLNRSNDRRMAFEEAAGIMTYRIRKEEAERKLDNTRKNLVRLNDIIVELDERLVVLEQQSVKAREYQTYRRELEDIEINVFLYQHDMIKKRLVGLDDAIAQLDGELNSKTALEASLAESCAVEEERERALGASMGKLQGELLALSTGVENKSGEAKLFRERMAGLLKERERLQAENTEAIQRRGELSGRVDSLCEACESKRAEHAGLAAELAAINGQIEAFERSIGQKSELVERQKAQMIEAMNRISDAKSRISRLEAIRGTMQARLGELNPQESLLNEKAAKLEGERLEAVKALEAMRMKREGRMDERASILQRIEAENAALADMRKSLRASEQQQEAGRSRLKVLEEMKRAHEGYYASVRSLLRDAERSNELSGHMEGVVAELMRVPKQYEPAIEMALGSALQNIVTRTESDAKFAIEYLRQKDYGRATFLPMSAMRSRTLTARERTACDGEGFIGVASELVGYDEAYRGVMENLLGRTVIVSDMDAGIDISRRSAAAFRIATLKGDIINPGGSMTGGSAQKREFSLIGRAREVDELKRRLELLTLDIARRATDCASAESAVAALNGQLISLGEALHESDVELATHHEKLEIIEKYARECDGALTELSLERSRLKDSIENIDAQFLDAQRASSLLEEGSAVTQADIKSTQDELGALRAQFAGAGGMAADMRVALMGLEKERDTLTGEIARTRRDIAAQTERIERNAKGVMEADAQYEGLQRQMSALGIDIDEELHRRDGLNDRLHLMDDERAKHIAALDEMRLRRDRINAEIREIEGRRGRAEINRSKSESELQYICDRIWDDYALTYENAQVHRHEIAVTASHKRIDELKLAIRELGEVNVQAIEDYRELKARYDGLVSQCDDLSRAEADLNRLIVELVATMECEFRKQFDRIKANFSDVFTELFGGGRAELVLSNANDILNCEIDIIAQPPGKKLQLLSLLSGGERALTAIALLFAILKLKPVAFCILDEIETSLDEVNVMNFAGYVKRYSADTQFILITHRKGSMEICDSLYGVSMEEKGVSKVVSARFEQTA